MSYDLTGETIELEHVSIEHMLGVEYGPLVKARITGEGGTVIAGLLTPANAREIANNLLNCAARAEYEADLERGLREELQMEPRMIAAIIHFVRYGEAERMGEEEGN